jgi:hypothetical protein
MKKSFLLLFASAKTVEISNKKSLQNQRPDILIVNILTPPLIPSTRDYIGKVLLITLLKLNQELI